MDGIGLDQSGAGDSLLGCAQMVAVPIQAMEAVSRAIGQNRAGAAARF